MVRIEKVNAKARHFKSLMPLPIRIWLKKKHQKFVFNNSLKEFAKDFYTIKSKDELIDRLIYGWGNQGFSAKSDYIKTIVGYAISTDGPILECGSGLSTILLHTIALRRGIEIISLEHDSYWGDIVLSKLGGEKPEERARLYVCPLRKYVDFDWYDISGVVLPEHFSLVVCDGPPGTTFGGRYGLVPIMSGRLSKSIILLDDFNRSEEKSIVSKWSKTLNISVKSTGRNDDCAIITVL